MRQESPYLPGQVADLINPKDTNNPPWQRALMSSQLDVDRLDYLRRDSLFTGAGYGHFDWHRLLTTIELYGGGSQGIDLVWPAKSALAIEEYIFARYYMYQNVYLHKTTRGYERLLRATWERARYLKEHGDNIGLNPVLKKFWRCSSPVPGKFAIADYLRIEEFTVLEQLQRWTQHADKSLADCSRRFLYRDGLAMVEPPAPPNPLEPHEFGDWEPELHKLLERHGFEEPSMYCLADKVDGKYLQPYREEKERDNQTAVNTIRVLVDGEPVAIGQYLPRLQSVIERPPARVLYYVPKELRQEANALRKRLEESRDSISISQE